MKTLNTMKQARTTETIEEAPEFESEMITLERIDVQKRYIKRSYVAKAKRAPFGGREI